MTKLWKNSRLVFALLLLLSGIIAFIDSFLIKEGVMMARGGDFMPRIVTFLWVIFSFIIVLKTSKEDAAKNTKKTENNEDQKGFILTLLLLIAYAFLVGILGFLLSSVIYLFVQILIFAPKSKHNYLLISIISVVIPVFIYWIFNSVFMLILPSGIIF